jgi:hypothetical protein
MANWTRYRIYCETEALWVPTYADSPPTVCPNNPAHTVRADSAAQLDSKRIILVPDADGQGILGGETGVGDEMERVIGATRIEKSTADTVPALVLQCSTGHPTGYGCLQIDMDVDGAALVIDSEATGFPLLTLDGVAGNSRGDLAFGVSRTSDPSTPSEGDFWFDGTGHHFKYRDDTTVRALVPDSEVYWANDGSGHIYAKTATDDLYIGGTTPNGVWFDNGNMVLGDNQMAGSERLKVVGTTFIDQDGNAVGLDIDSEATGAPLINLQPLLSNTRGDIAFGAVRTADPSTPSEGDFWYNSTDDVLKYYDGTAVQTLTTAGMTSPWSEAGGVIYPTTFATDDVVVGANAMSSGERFRVVGGARIEKGDAQNDSGLYLQVSGSHPTGATYPGLLLDVDVNVPGLDIDSEATGHPLINLQPINGNSRGDIAFGTGRTGDPSAPSEGDLWYESTSEELKFRKSASTVEVRDAYKLQGRSVAATAPTDGQVLTWNNTGTQWEPQAAPGPYSNIAEANGDITTTSTTDVLATGMTITPAAGTYMVWFSSTVGSDSNNANVWASIYSGGTLVSGSERELMRGAAQGNVTIGFSCIARVTVNGAQAIEGRWRVTTGTTGTMHNGRTLAIIRVA